MAQSAHCFTSMMIILSFMDIETIIFIYLIIGIYYKHVSMQDAVLNPAAVGNTGQNIRSC